jgi:hypothetical protein
MNVATANTFFASVPKAGHRIAENEDAAAAGPGRYAVADGATEGWQSGPWAKILVDAFAAAAPTPASFDAWLAGCRAQFAALHPPEPAAWYAEAKREQGAFATLLGLELRASPRGPAWRAVAVGDCCLFRVSSGTVADCWPVERAEDFGTRPELLATVGACPAPAWFAGRAEPGDRFYLLTDALAEWLYRYPHAWLELDAALGGDFTAWVAELRAAKRIKNDDATALRAVAPVPGGTL